MEKGKTRLEDINVRRKSFDDLVQEELTSLEGLIKEDGDFVPRVDSPLPTETPVEDAVVIEEDDQPEDHTESLEEAASDDSEDEREHKEHWERFVVVCKSKNLDPLVEFVSHIIEINPDVRDELMFLVQQLSVDEIQQLIAKVADSPQSSSTKTKPDVKQTESKAETAVIHLQKGFDANGIKQFILRIDSQLQTQTYKDLNIITNDWDTSGEFFALIPAAKKLFAKYVEAGLLGCLIARGYVEAAKKLYCVAFVRGKQVGDNIVFKGIQPDDYKNKVANSLSSYTQIIKSGKTIPKKKVPIDVKK